MKTLLLFLILLVSSTALAAGAGSYSATDSDKSIKSLVTRWASLDGRLVEWEASGDFPVVDAEKLNARAHLAGAETLNDAFNRVAVLVRNEKPDAPILFACSYDLGRVALVVREAGQPECGKAIK